MTLLLSSLLPGCAAIVHHAYAGRNDSFCACVQAVKSPGDECRLHAGVYELGTTQCNVSNVRGTPEQPIVIAAAAIDGREKQHYGKLVLPCVPKREPGSDVKCQNQTYRFIVRTVYIDLYCISITCSVIGITSTEMLDQSHHKAR